MLDNNNQTNDQVVNENQANKQDNGQIVNNNQVNDQASKREENKEKGKFYGILAVAIFIIMAVGATFAYFTASTNSGQRSIKTGSARMSLEFISYESAWLAQNLIPAYTNVVEYSVERRPVVETNDGEKYRKMCVDDAGREICSLYVFQVKNSDVGSMNVTVSLRSDTNGFYDEYNGGSSDLYAMLYKVEPITSGNDYATAPAQDPDPVFVTEENNGDGQTCDPNVENNGCVQVVNGEGIGMTEGFTPVYVNRFGVQKELQRVSETSEEGGVTTTTVVPSIDRQVPLEGQEAVKLNDSVTIPGNGYVTMMIVLYIKDNGQNQNYAAGKQFEGTVIVSGLDSATGGITGKIGGVERDDFTGLQSVTTPSTEPTTESTSEPTT